jgi:non-specific serine/threonine protein kinase
MGMLEVALEPLDLLLVLDNCEHLIQACAELAENLLRSCPRLTILATSREPLRVPGEVIWRVSALSVPDPDRLPTLEELVRYEAVQLFTSRAQAALPTFAVTAGNAAALARLCSRLDGIPLAIELAAARIPSLSVEQIAARLEGRIGLLTTGCRTVLPRHRTLEGAVDWSYALLSEREREVFRSLAIFAGGFDLEAAEAVCDEAMWDGGPGAGDRATASFLTPHSSILDALSNLVDKSLVVAEARADGAVRYRLLEPIRQYARERLAAAGEVARAGQRHTEYFQTLAERAEPELYGPNQGAWLDRLELEHDNFRTALGWLVGPGELFGGVAADADLADRDPLAGLRLGWVLMRFWDMRGYLTEGRAWLAALLAVNGTSRSSGARARALFGAGRLAYEQGEYDTAMTLSEESLAVARAVGDRECVAFALTQIGHVLRIRGDPEASRPLYEESLAIRRELAAQGASTFRPGIAVSVKCLGGVALARGDLETARDLYTESLSIERNLGHQWEIALSLHRLGEIATDLGRLDEARARFEEALAVARELSDRQNVALVLGGIAALAAVKGELERAARLIGAADGLRETIGCVLDPADRARVERRLTGTRAVLGEERTARLRAEGRAQPADGAMAEAHEILARLARAPAGQGLTRREREVSLLIARGLTNREIAAELVIAEWTVVNHVRSIMRKLDVGSRAQVAAWAVVQGLAMGGTAVDPVERVRSRPAGCRETVLQPSVM